MTVPEDVLAGEIPAPAHEKRAFLSVRDLRVHFPTDDGLVKSVDGLSFTLEKGKTLGIVGESGSGKSVTATAILRLIRKPGRLTGGSIMLGGRDLARLDEEELQKVRGTEITMISQTPRILSWRRSKRSSRPSSLSSASVGSRAVPAVMGWPLRSRARKHRRRGPAWRPPPPGSVAGAGRG